MSNEFDIELFDRAKDCYVDAKLLKQPDPELVARTEELWRGWMEGVADIDATHSLKLKLPFTYGHWAWGYKAQRARRVLTEELYAITRTENPGTIRARVWVEGMMQLVTLAIDCKEPSHKGRKAIYVELIASAPWNLPGVLQPPRYAYVGLTLMRRAIDVSRDLGMKGRLGLHALDDASDWYRKLGLVSLGRDPNKQNLEYFELTESAAEAFYPSKGDIND